MRAGLPVVAADIGGVCKAVGERSEWLPRPSARRGAAGGEAGVADYLCRFTAKYGPRSRRRFSQNFEWRAMLDKKETLYASAARHVRSQEVSQ
jgi:glycosyltransferase involved in cell wall biosynthesis